MTSIQTWEDFMPEPDDFERREEYEAWLAKQPASVQRRIKFQFDDMCDTIKQEEQNA